MNPRETGKLLGVCAAFDRRTVGEADVIAWTQALSGLDYADCEAAVVAHYRDSRDWIMPADIRGRVKRARRDVEDRAKVRELLDPQAYRRSVEQADAAFLRKLAARRPKAAIEQRPAVAGQPRARPAGPDHPSRAEQLAALKKWQQEHPEEETA